MQTTDGRLLSAPRTGGDGPERAREDLERSRALLRAGSKSFFAASRLLPRDVRDPATVLYAFMRVADDLVDQENGGPEAVAELHRRLEVVFAGRPADLPEDRALARVIRERNLPRAPFDLLLDGLLWDTEEVVYETFDELTAYCVRVAGTVGVLMAALMERRDETSLARANDLGVAMQLTNIARDVGEDARRGRIYLPQQWLREAGVAPSELLRSPRFSAGLGDVVVRLLDRADALYARADEGIARLPRRHRPAIRGARLVYADIGREIRRAGGDSVSARAVVPTRRKLWLLLRALPAVLWRPGDDGDPPLEAAFELVSGAAASPAGSSPRAASSETRAPDAADRLLPSETHAPDAADRLLPGETP